MKEFLARFDYRPEGHLLVGIERECHLVDEQGSIVPISPRVLEHLGIGPRFGYELSACQLEDRIGPCSIDQVKHELIANEITIKESERALGFRRSFAEVAPDDMPLDVFPDPTGRYQLIVKTLPKEVLLAACQVIGTHVHIGMSDHRTALQVYNRVIERCDQLCEMGDGSEGKRLAIYRIMAPDFRAPRYESWDEYYHEALAKDFVADPRKCWHLIRLSVHGTIEFRMFGATTDLDRVVSWARACYDLCVKALR